MSGKGQSKLELSGNGNECKPLAHGVYSPGNVKLTPPILGNSQVYISEKLGLKPDDKPVYFVFHGGSGSSREAGRCTLTLSNPS